MERFDPPKDPIAALAEEIANRLALKLGSQVSHLAASANPAPAQELWTARRVASHYGVGVSFVYQHADELGCVRLGGGRCPRLRFDPVAVQARWAHVGRELPAERPERRRSRSRRRPAIRRDEEDQLLEFEREP